MRIIFGSDHRGINLKQALLAYAAAQGHECADAGCDGSTPVDYPDIARLVGGAVVAKRADCGVLVCGTGLGMSIAANKLEGIRAALCHNTYTATMARKHNDANVLCLGETVVGRGLAQEIAAAFFSTEFEGGRHTRRVEKIRALEVTGR